MLAYGGKELVSSSRRRREILVVELGLAFPMYPPIAQREIPMVGVRGGMAPPYLPSLAPAPASLSPRSSRLLLSARQDGKHGPLLCVTLGSALG